MCVCGAHDIRWAWTSPAHGTHGLGWCGPCADATWARSDDERPAATILDYLENGQDGRGLAGLLGVRSAYGCCPLCGLGEASSEHLMIFCPVVEAAWRAVRTRQEGPAPPFLAACRVGDHDSVDRAACRVVLHQTSYWYASLSIDGAAALWAVNARLLIQSCKWQLFRQCGAATDYDLDDDMGREACEDDAGASARQAADNQGHVGLLAV